MKEWTCRLADRGVSHGGPGLLLQEEPQAWLPPPFSSALKGKGRKEQDRGRATVRERGEVSVGVPPFGALEKTFRSIHEGTGMALSKSGVSSQPKRC